MPQYTDIITSAPNITVRPPMADGTLTIDGGTAMVAGTVIVAKKGWPFKIHTVSKPQIESVFGKPLPNNAANSEGLRHVHQAAKQAQYIKAVRVVASDAVYPVVMLSKVAGTAVLKTAIGYDVEPTLGVDHWLAIYPIDGEESTNRRVSIQNIDTVAARFDIVFQQDIGGGVWQNIPDESYTVGLNHDDADDVGAPAYIESVLADNSARFNCVVSADASMSMVIAAQEAFVGGLTGSDPITADFNRAWDILRTADEDFDGLFLAGNYDPVVIANAVSVAQSKLSPIKYDAPPYLSEVSAIAWVQSLNIDNYFAQCCHYPYLSTDEFYGGKTLFGISGDLIASKSICYKKPTGHGAVRGAHYAPAGNDRGRIARRGVEPKFNSNFATKEDLVSNRITWVDKGVVIGDVLTTHKKNNDLRFEHVVSTLVDIQKEFYQAAKYAHFEPGNDAATLLEKLGNDICSRRVTAGALIKPTDPNWNGEANFKIVITKLSMDLFEARAIYANVGIARRISIQVELTR